MPAQSLLHAQVPSDTCLKVLFGTAGVYVTASRKHEIAKASYLNTYRLLNFDVQLVGSRRCHRVTDSHDLAVDERVLIEPVDGAHTVVTIRNYDPPIQRVSH